MCGQRQGARGWSHTFRLAPVCQVHTKVVFTFAECRDRAENGNGSPVEASGSHRGSPGRPVRAPGSFQSATSAPEWGKSKSVSMLFKRGVLVPFDPPVNPTGFQAHWELIFPMLDPSAGCLIRSLNPSFIREDPQACDISLLFQLTCQGQIPTRPFLLHSYQAPCCPSSVSLV